MAFGAYMSTKTLVLTATGMETEAILAALTIWAGGGRAAAAAAAPEMIVSAAGERVARCSRGALALELMVLHGAGGTFAAALLCTSARVWKKKRKRSIRVKHKWTSIFFFFSINHSPTHFP